MSALGGGGGRPAGSVGFDGAGAYQFYGTLLPYAQRDLEHTVLPGDEEPLRGESRSFPFQIVMLMLVVSACSVLIVVLLSRSAQHA